MLSELKGSGQRQFPDKIMFLL